MQQTAQRRHRTRRASRSRRPPWRIPARLRERPLWRAFFAAALLWLAWQIVSNTAADNLAASEPRTALAWSPHHAGALTALADVELQPPTDADQDTAATSADAGEADAEGAALDTNADIANDPADDEVDPGLADDDSGAGDATESDAVGDMAGSGDNTIAAGADLEAINALAMRALRENPLEADAFRVLALTAEAKGDSAKAQSLMDLAAKRAKRDPRVEAWLLAQRLTDGDVDGALASMDAMLRTWPNGRDLVFPVLASLASDPNASKPLITLLERDPPWRSWFLTTFPRQATDPQALEAFYGALRAGPQALTTDEFKAFLDRLIALGRYEDAFAHRVDFSAPGWVSTLGNINNGGFEYPVDGLPFGWQIRQVQGAETRVDQESGDNHALHVEFYNARVLYHHVYQLLLLRPGTYELSGRVRARTLRNERGLEWTVVCLQKNGDMLAETDRTSGTLKWTTFTTTFEVPDTDTCRMQVLRLVLPARVPSEADIAGDIWYDDLQITPRDDVTPVQ